PQTASLPTTPVRRPNPVKVVNAATEGHWILLGDRTPFRRSGCGIGGCDRATGRDRRPDRIARAQSTQWLTLLAEQYGHQSHSNRQRAQPEDEQQETTEDDEGSKARPLDDAKKGRRS